MYTNVYFIRDRVSNTVVTNPIPAINDGVAIQGFMSYCKKEKEERSLNPALFELVLASRFSETGIFSTDFSPVTLCNGDTADEVFQEWCAKAIQEE